MHWPRDAVTRIAERQERDALHRYLELRKVNPSAVWVEIVGEASRRADAVIRLERQLQRMR